MCGEQLHWPRRADGHRLPPQQGSEGTFAKRGRAEGQPLLRRVPGRVPRRSQPGRAGEGGVRGQLWPSLQDGDPRRLLKAELLFARRCLLYTCYFIGKSPSISHPVNEAMAVAAPPAASLEAKASESAVSLPRSRLLSPTSP